MNTLRLGSSVRQLVLGSLTVASLSCQGSTRQGAGAPYPGPGTSSNWAAPPSSSVEAHYAPHAPRQLGTAMLFLPGSPTQQQVKFETVDGLAVLEGDIMLGPATALPFRYGMLRQSSLDSKSAVALADRSYLWPNAEIPYAIDASAQGKAQAIAWAVQQFDGAGLKLRPVNASDRDYVVFRELRGGCWSYLGRQGGAQDIDVSSCGGGSIAHELMHAAGFYHEQSRGDRDQHITIMWDEISPEMRFNFDKRDGRGQDIGPYDYASIMHYPSHAGSKSGNPTIVPRQPGARIGQREGLSVLDRAAIATLYGTSTRQPGVPLPPPPAPVAAAPPGALPPPAVLPPAVPAAAPPPMPPTTTPMPSAAAPGASASFTGTYGSSRGNVSCTQGGVFAQCQYPGGSLFCAANGPELACTWSGGGQGRAVFQRQPSGVLAGTWGDGFSADSRGRWDLTPLQSSSAQPAAASPSPVSPSPVLPSPVPAPAQAPPVPAPSAPAANVPSLSGNYTSTRGAMACVESGASVSCNFQEPDGVPGRLDCTKSQSALELSCAWITFLPRPGTGRAAFTRANTADRRWKGTWGHFLTTTGGGNWDIQRQ